MHVPPERSSSSSASQKRRPRAVGWSALSWLGSAVVLASATLIPATAADSRLASVSLPPPLAPELTRAFAAAPPPAPRVFEVPAPARATAPAASIVTRGEIRRDHSLSATLLAQGVPRPVVLAIARELAPLFDFRRSQPGHRYWLSRTPDGALLDFWYVVSSRDGIHLRREGEGYVAHREPGELIARPARVAGVIASSLYDALKEVGEETQLAANFAEIFAWDLDFSRAVRPGDEYQIYYERLYYEDDRGNEVYLHPGRILAARLSGSAGRHTAVYFETDEETESYYHPDGSSVKRQFLAAPLRFSRISSTYSRARRHPILNVTRPHWGIDYAAPDGSPLWAVADGTVIFRSRAGASGNLIKIRHTNGYVSHYAHLSRFAEGLEVGDSVWQKQIVGYVGQTGLATGPHVCFRISKNGRYLNPIEHRSPAGAPVPGSARDGFFVARDALLAQLEGATLVASDGAL